MAFGPPTIAAQRACEAAQGLVVRRRNQWGARRSYTDENPVTHPASFLFLHISVTNPSNYSSNDRHAQAIEGIGISRFPNTGISYNMGIMPNGAIYEFQPLGRRGAHTVNNFNRRTCATSGCPSRGTSLGSQNNLNYNARAIVLCQNVNDPVTSAQVHSIAKVGATWKRCGYATRGARWHGHRCVSAKSCPADRAWAQMSTISALTEHYTVHGLGTSTGDDDMSAQDVWDWDVNNRALGTPMDADDALSYTHFEAYSAKMAAQSAVTKLDQLLARPAVDIDALAAAIVAKLPADSIDLAIVKQGVREVLLEGVAPDSEPELPKA
ncbi:MAG: peptidoglycan recognition protein family protein [Acidimicrobiales bacterium]